MRVVIADDALLIREGVARVLQTDGVEVVGVAGDLDQLLAVVAERGPDVAVVDIRMPPSHTDEGIRATRRIREDHPATSVLVLSQHLEAEYATELLEVGAEGVGYLLKDRVVEATMFLDALRRVAAGDTVIDPAIVSRLIARRRSPDPLAVLTEREREVLSLLAEGLSNRAIADRCFAAERTVEAHVTSIFMKLGLAASPDAHRRVLAVLTYLRR